MPLDDTHFNSAFRQLRNEQIVYGKSTGVERTIWAAVTRRRLEPVSNEAVRPFLTINVENSATLGISSAEFDSGTDYLKLPERLGGTAVTWRNLELVSHDAGSLDIEVR